MSLLVKWTEPGKSGTLEYAKATYPDDFNPDDFDKEYRGWVIDTNKSLWGYTYLVVACEDEKVREIEISKVQIIRTISIPR